MGLVKRNNEKYTVMYRTPYCVRLMKSERLCMMVQNGEDKVCMYKSGGANCWKTATWKTKEL
jgi:hypothetical protein